MTFNTQHCRNYIKDFIDYDIMAEAIRTCGADIVGLNEIRDLGEDPDYYGPQLKELSERTGLPYFYFAEAIRFDSGKNPYGNGILSKYPLRDLKTVPIPDPPMEGRNPKGYYETRCLLCATADIGDSELALRISHFGLNTDEQASAVSTVIGTLPNEKCVVMGDFNSHPDDPVLAPLYDRLTDTAQATGLTKLSFPSDTPWEKIDYIFVTPDIEIKEADIPEIIASDHRPHTVTVSI